jgi:hypothetical protein
MNRWIVRIIGILMLLGFLLLFAHLQSRLVQLQQNQGSVPSR